MPTLRSLRYRRVINQKPVGGTPLALFRNGQDGFWLDPSDLDSLWVDQARTQHPTAPGDVVWWIDDKSPNQNHFGAVSSAARGRLYRWPASAVLEGYPRNFLNYTEDLSSWANAGEEVSVAAGATDPDGGNTAFTLTGVSGSCRLTDIAGQLTPGTTATFSIWARSVSGTPSIRLYTGGSTSGPIAITTEWAIYQYTTTVGETNLGTAQIRIMEIGDVVEVWKPQNEHGDVRTPYQRVGSGIWDVTEEGQEDCWGIGFDGVTTNYLSTRGIPNFVDGKLRMLAGQTKLSASANPQYIVTNKIGISTNDIATIYTERPVNTYSALYKSSATTTARSPSTYAPPNSAILDSLVGALEGSVSFIVNDASPVTATTGAGLLSAGQWTIGNNLEGSRPYNGIIWGTILVAEEPDEVIWNESVRDWLSNHNMGGILL